MTENKRFTIKPSSIVDDCFVIIDNDKKYTFPTLESTLNYMFCKALNELHKENEILTDAFEQHLKRKDNRIKELKEENEQLKQQEKRLYNYFRKCFNNVSEQEFCETWEVVKKYD